jgi:hypothetical protein
LIHIARRAPVLSEIVNIVCCWIIVSPHRLPVAD